MGGIRWGSLNSSDAGVCYEILWLKCGELRFYYNSRGDELEMKDMMVRLTLVCLTLIVISMSTGISYALAPSAVVGMWLLDEGEGQTVGDSSGNGHDGEFAGNPQWVQGKFGNAAHFPEGRPLRVPHDDSLSLTTWSITVWTKLESTGVWQFIFAKQKPSEVRNYALWVHRDAGFVYADFHCEAGSRQAKGKTNILDDRWHHVAGTYDMKTLRLYVDGELEAELPATDTPDTNKGPLTIGSDDAPTGSCPAKGIIDEVGLFNRALTKSEIKNIMEVGLAEASQAVEASGKLSTAWGKIKVERH